MLIYWYVLWFFTLDQCWIEGCKTVSEIKKWQIIFFIVKFGQEWFIFTLYPTDCTLSPAHILPLPLQTIPSTLTAAGGMGVGTNTNLNLGTTLANGHHPSHLQHPNPNHHPNHHSQHHPTNHHHPHSLHHPIQNHLSHEHHLNSQHHINHHHRFSAENSGNSTLVYNVNNQNNNNNTNSNSDIQTPPPSHTSIDSSYSLGLVSKIMFYTSFIKLQFDNYCKNR